MTDYALLHAQCAALTDGEPDALANVSNICALVFAELADVNWAGVYLLRDDTLVLGPFQGNTACVRIAVGAGVCGTAVAERRILRVADVHAFEGHIACDAASESEIVLPLISGDTLWGVLDIDSPSKDRFSEDDEAGLSAIAQLISDRVNRSPGSLGLSASP
ncbi:MAG: GAF domain-containing protein [Pseudomonadota bacterium]